MAILRRSYRFSGEVQGVGFRMTARRISSEFLVTGFVRNQSDGRVELVAEGEASVLISFIEAIQAEFGDRISEIAESELPATDSEFEGFSIRF